MCAWCASLAHTLFTQRPRAVPCTESEAGVALAPHGCANDLLWNVCTCAGFHQEGVGAAYGQCRNLSRTYGMLGMHGLWVPCMQ